MLCDYNIQMGGGTLKIIMFEKVNVSTQSDANKFTHRTRFVSQS